MGGRSGQSIGTNILSDSDYVKVAAANQIFSGTGNNSIEKTINAYTKEGFFVNRRIIENTLNDNDRQYIKNLNKALDSLPKFKENIELYRQVNIDNNLLKNLGKDSEIMFKGFTSTTKLLDKAKLFTKTTPQNKTRVLFVIKKQKSGRDIMDYSFYKSEEEVLFKTNTKWRVISIKNKTIEIEEI